MRAFHIAVLIATALAVLDAAPYRQRYQGGYYPQAYYGDGAYGYSPYYHDSFAGYPYSLGGYQPSRANPFQSSFYNRFTSWPANIRLPSNPFRFGFPGQSKKQGAQPSLIAVVAPGADRDQSDDEIDQPQRPVVLVLNNGALDADDEHQQSVFDLGNLVGNLHHYDPEAAELEQAHAPALQHSPTQDGFVGATSQAQFEPAPVAAEEPEFVQPELSPVVVPEPVVADPVQQEEQKPLVQEQPEQVVSKPIAVVAEPVQETEKVEPVAEVQPVEVQEPVAVVAEPVQEAEKPEPVAVESEPAVEAKPAEEAPTEDKPAEDATAEAKPAEETAAEVKPVEDSPVEAKPVEDSPAEVKPMEDSPVEPVPVEEPVQDAQAVEPAEQVVVVPLIPLEIGQPEAVAEFIPVAEEEQKPAEDVKVESDVNEVAVEPVPIEPVPAEADSPVVAIPVAAEAHDLAPEAEQPVVQPEPAIFTAFEDGKIEEAAHDTVKEVAPTNEQVKVADESAVQAEVSEEKIPVEEAAHDEIQHQVEHAEEQKPAEPAQEDAVPVEQVQEAEQKPAEVAVEDAKQEEEQKPVEAVQADEKPEEEQKPVEQVQEDAKEEEQKPVVEQVQEDAKEEAEEKPVESVQQDEKSEEEQKPLEQSDSKPVEDQPAPAEEEKVQIQPVETEPAKEPQADSQLIANEQQPAQGQEQPVFFGEEVVVSSDSLAVSQPNAPSPAVVAIPERVESADEQTIVEIQPVESAEKVPEPQADDQKAAEQAEPAKEAHKHSDDCRVEYIVVNDDDIARLKAEHPDAIEYRPPQARFATRSKGRITH